ncbi:MAG: Gfo/Idh/MocA family oxidoreductase [Chloroflexi bacterium]|nr:Gfo/Idh/MocA family oxidoreductase [Chloroflexota bacterium]
MGFASFKFRLLPLAQPVTTSLSRQKGSEMIGCALIGNGYWGSKLKKYIEENPNFDLKYVCNSRSDLNRVWRDGTISAVVVATPNETHYPIIRAALLHGKNVLSEKPLTLEGGQCRELGQIASDADRILAVEYVYTFSRALKQAQGLIGAGEIGNILGMEMAVKHLGRFKGGSVYWLLGSHMLSVLDMFVPLTDLSFEKRDMVTCEGEVETGVISFGKPGFEGQIVVSLNYPGKDTSVVIYGENGTIIYDPVNQPALRLDKYQRMKWTIADKLPREHKEFCIDENNNLRYAIEYFYEALSGRAKSNAGLATEITTVLQMLQVDKGVGGGEGRS